MTDGILIEFAGTLLGFDDYVSMFFQSTLVLTPADTASRLWLMDIR